MPSTLSQRRILVDSSAYLALRDRADAHHHEATAILTSLARQRYRLYTADCYSKKRSTPSERWLACQDSLLSIQNLKVPLVEIETFCRRWQVAELSLFGSVLREDFRPDSDVDILISFAPSAEPSLLDHVAMQEELAELFGRRVDLVTRPAIERSSNWIRRRAILGTAQRVYAA